MRLSAQASRELFAAARSALLATVSLEGVPHAVPVTFVVVGDQIVTAVDAKPKTGRELRRVRNARASPRVCLLADHYEDDWTRLWWARADGLATVTAAAAPELRSALAARYEPYQTSPPDGPFIVVDVDRWSGWAAHPRALGP